MDGTRRKRAALCNRPDETHRPNRLGPASTPQCMSAIGLYTYVGYGIDRYVRLCRRFGLQINQIIKS